ncbi:MAG: cytochrome c maturation protein CcmE [Spirochaetales bacterium]|nr:MAG: cytochrome c maturation protein CcmE [Spirochaetales bacterium]
MSAKRIVGILIVAACVAVAAFSMRGMLTPYVSFADAMKSGEYVQIIGMRPKSAPVENMKGSFAFTLRDENGASLRVVHRGVRPQNFEHADRIVALGTYDPQGGIFVADRLLVKCPSKYTGEKQQ